jgi:hypothetical protein
VQAGDGPDLKTPKWLVVEPTRVSCYSPVGVQWSISLNDVIEIAAWKDDLFAYDVICVGFRRRGRRDYDWCDEEMTGWDDLMRFLQSRYGLDREAWIMDVARPAFERCFRTLWGQPIEPDEYESR